MCNFIKNIFNKYKETSELNKMQTITKNAGISAIKNYIDIYKNEKKEHIIIHHSATKDGKLRDWENITKYHTSWRYKGNIISHTMAKKLMASGCDVERPFVSNGYHLGIELIGNQYIYRKGRLLSMEGAACRQQRMNWTGVQVCIIGNFDKEPPTKIHYWLAASLCRHIMEAYNFPIDNIYPHSYFAQKSCPGKLFDWNTLMRYIKGGV